LSNWFLFLSSFVFPLLFRHCFIPVSLAHVVSSLAYPNLLGTKRLGCCCCCCMKIVNNIDSLILQYSLSLKSYTLNDRWTSLTCCALLPHVGISRGTCATTGEGLYEGLDWLSSNIGNKVLYSFMCNCHISLANRCTFNQQPLGFGICIDIVMLYTYISFA
jgi:hypothetical protein